MQRRSKRKLRALVRKHKAAGRVVIVMGDFNIRPRFWVAKGFHWLRGVGICKIGATRKGTGGTFPAPTDHKQGIKASIRL